MDVFELVVQHELGYYHLLDKPSEAALKSYYRDSYYQKSKGTYTKSYSKEEEIFRTNRLQRKLTVYEQHLSNGEREYLDIGCGEGWGMAFFKKAGWTVTGLDYSSAGIEHFNSELLADLHQGDIYDNLEQLPDDTYTNILLDNVLEHVLDPLALMDMIKRKCRTGGLITVEVPNDFSPLQLKLCEENKLDKPNWVVSPDHINYFSLDSLRNLMKSKGLQFVDAITDFPIDFFLANQNSNYYQRPETGKDAHQARLMLENLMDEISTEKTIDFYRSMINLGFGRNIVAFFRKS
jgi:SAM-dependent methyltransferase